MECSACTRRQLYCHGITVGGENCPQGSSLSHQISLMVLCIQAISCIPVCQWRLNVSPVPALSLKPWSPEHGYFQRLPSIGWLLRGLFHSYLVVGLDFRSCFFEFCHRVGALFSLTLTPFFVGATSSSTSSNAFTSNFSIKPLHLVLPERFFWRT